MKVQKSRIYIIFAVALIISIVAQSSSVNLLSMLVGREITRSTTVKVNESQTMNPPELNDSMPLTNFNYTFVYSWYWNIGATLNIYVSGGCCSKVLFDVKKTTSGWILVPYNLQPYQCWFEYESCPVEGEVNLGKINQGNYTLLLMQKTRSDIYIVHKTLWKFWVEGIPPAPIRDKDEFHKHIDGYAARDVTPSKHIAVANKIREIGGTLQYEVNITNVTGERWWLYFYYRGDIEGLIELVEENPGVAIIANNGRNVWMYEGIPQYAR